MCTREAFLSIWGGRVHERCWTPLIRLKTIPYRYNAIQIYFHSNQLINYRCKKRNSEMLYFMIYMYIYMRQETIEVFQAWPFFFDHWNTMFPCVLWVSGCFQLLGQRGSSWPAAKGRLLKKLQMHLYEGAEKLVLQYFGVLWL